MRCIWLVAVAGLWLLPGCFLSRTKVERPIDAEQVARIEVGKTTQREVVRILGAPTDIIFSNREHNPLRVFAYEYTP